MPESLSSWFAERWCQKDVGHAGLSPQRGHAKLLWPEDGACHSFGCHPTMVIPRRRCREPSSALGELLVRREGEEAASPKMALTLSASHTPSTAPTLGLVPGPAGTLPTAATAPKSSRERGGRPGWVAGGGRRRWRGRCSSEGHSAPLPPPCSPQHGGSVEGILVFHRPGPAPGTVSLVVVLGTGGRRLRPALGAVAAAPGTLQAVVGCGDRDSGGHGHPLSRWWYWWARGCCAAEVVWGWQVDPTAWWLRHEGWRGAGVCKGNRSLTPPVLPVGSAPSHSPSPSLTLSFSNPPSRSLPAQRDTPSLADLPVPLRGLTPTARDRGSHRHSPAAARS